MQCSRIADLLLIFLLATTPLAYGTVHAPAIIILALISVLIFNLNYTNANTSLSKSPARPFIGLGIFFTIFGIFQLLPLPAAFLKYISPSAFSLYTEYSIEHPGSGAWHPISVYPWATIFDLIQFLSYCLIFLAIVYRTDREKAVSSELPGRSAAFAYLQLGCLTGVLAILFHSFYDFNLHISANAFYFTCLLALACGTDNNFFQKIIRTIIIIGFLVSIFAIVHKFGLVEWIYSKSVRSAKPMGPYINYNHYAGFMELCVPLAVASAVAALKRSSFFMGRSIAKKILWFSTKEATEMILYLFVSVIMCTSVFVSTSRGGIISLCLALSLFFLSVFFKAAKKLKTKLFICFVIICLCVTSMVMWLGPRPLLKKLKTSYSYEMVKTGKPLDSRIIFWKDTLKIINDYPITGTGIGTFGSMFPAYRSHWYAKRSLRYAHNDYLQYLSEAGIFGLICIILFFTFFIKRYLTILDKTE